MTNEEDTAEGEELSDEEFEKQRAYWEPLYRAEKKAGLLNCPACGMTHPANYSCPDI